MPETVLENEDKRPFRTICFSEMQRFNSISQKCRGTIAFLKNIETFIKIGQKRENV